MLQGKEIVFLQATKSGDLFQYSENISSVDGSVVFKLMGTGGVFVTTRNDHTINKKVHVSSVQPVSRASSDISITKPPTTTSSPVVKVIVKPNSHPGDPPNLFVAEPRKQQG